MKEKLKEVLKDNYINYIDDCLAFIMAVERGLQPRHTDRYIVNSCYVAGLIIFDSQINGYKFTGEKSSVKYAGYQWVVDDYMQLFLDAGMLKSKMYTSQTVGKMKKLFYHNPELTPKGVIVATKIYITDMLNKGSVDYLREPRYFIYKGKVEESDLMSFIDYVEEENNKFKSVKESTLPSNIRIQ